MDNRVEVNCRNTDCLWNIGGVCTNPDSITIDEDLKCEEYEEMPEDYL